MTYLRKWWAAALVASMTGAVQAAEVVTLRVHHFLPASSTAHVKFIAPWCAKIQSDSGGQLKCQIYPSMQLGGTPPQLFDQVKDGVADIVWTLPGYQAGRFMVIEAFELPFMTAAESQKSSRALWHEQRVPGCTAAHLSRWRGGDLSYKLQTYSDPGRLQGSETARTHSAGQQADWCAWWRARRDAGSAGG